jgi:tetratricopeptide (TPR) repeat protein
MLMHILPWDMYFMSIDKPSKALESYKTALRLNPIPPIKYLREIGAAYRYLGEYEKAIKIYKRCMKRAPNDAFSYIAIVVAYSLAGQEDNAKIAVGKLLNLFPGFSIEVAKKYPAYNNPDQTERAIKALRNAGVPETAQ